MSLATDTGGVLYHRNGISTRPPNASGAKCSRKKRVWSSATKKRPDRVEGRPWRCGAFGRSPDRHTRASRQTGSIPVRVIGATPAFPRPVHPTISARRTTFHRRYRRNSAILAAGRRQACRNPGRRWARPNCSGRSCPRGPRGRSGPLRGHGPGRRRGKRTAGANRSLDNFPDSC